MRPNPKAFGTVQLLSYPDAKRGRFKLITISVNVDEHANRFDP